MQDRHWSRANGQSWLRARIPREVHSKFKDAAAIMGQNIEETYRLFLCWLAHGQTGETLAAAIEEARQEDAELTRKEVMRDLTYLDDLDESEVHERWGK